MLCVHCVNYIFEGIDYMKVLRKKKTREGIASLVLEDNISIYLKDRKIAKYKGNTYNNIKDYDWIQDGFLQFALHNYFDRPSKEFMEALKNFK